MLRPGETPHGLLKPRSWEDGFPCAPTPPPCDCCDAAVTAQDRRRNRNVWVESDAFRAIRSSKQEMASRALWTLGPLGGCVVVRPALKCQGLFSPCIGLRRAGGALMSSASTSAALRFLPAPEPGSFLLPWRLLAASRKHCLSCCRSSDPTLGRPSKTALPVLRMLSRWRRLATPVVPFKGRM